VFEKLNLGSVALYSNEKEMLIIHQNTKDAEKCLIVNVSVNSKSGSEIEVINDNEINLKVNK